MLRVLVVLCFFHIVFANLSYAPITNTTISIQWDPLIGGAFYPSKYQLVDVQSDGSHNRIYNSIDNNVELLISPSTVYNLLVCRNVSASEEFCCDSDGCTLNFGQTFMPLEVDINFPVDYGTVITLDSTRAAFVFPARLGQVSNEYLIEVLELDFQDNATWSILQTERSNFDETPDDIYSIVVNVIPGEKRLYRITRLPFISEPFWYESPPTTYQSNINAVSVVTVPHTGPNFVTVDELTTQPFSFNMDNAIPPTCADLPLISARLTVAVQQGTFNKGAGYVRVFEANETDPNYYISSPFVQFVEGSPFLFSETFHINLDHIIPRDALAMIKSSAIAGEQLQLRAAFQNNHNGPDKNNTSFVVQTVHLELAYENIIPPIQTAGIVYNSAFFASDRTNSQLEFNIDLDDFALPGSTIITAVTVTVSANFKDTNGADMNFLSVILANGAVGSVELTDNVGAAIDNCDIGITPVNIVIGPEDYSLVQGGFPGIDYSGGPNRLYFRFSGGEVCIRDITVQLHYVLNNPDTCIPIITPSNSNTRTPSVSPTVSPSASPSGQPVPSPTPLPSPTLINSPSLPVTPIPSISVAESITAAVSASGSPIPSRSVPASASLPPLPTSVRSPMPSAIQSAPRPSVAPSPSRGNPNPSVQPTTIPAIPVNQPIPIVDDNGNVIITVEFETPNGGSLNVNPGNGISSLGGQNIDSPLVDFILLDQFGFEVQPTGGVTICIETPADSDDACLGFLDEKSKPPRWECEDPCLDRNDDGFLCGSTRHFTSFAVLLGGNQADCKESGDLIFNKAWKDGVLIGSITAGLLCFLLVGAIFLAVTPLGSRIVRGEEGHRVSRLRDETTSGPLTVEVDSV